MNWPFAILAMFALMMAVVFLTTRRGAQNRERDELPPEGPSPREIEMEEELKQLRERLKVLERIATEDRAAKRLSSEIEDLRDD